MKRISIVGLFLAAVFAFSAMAASSASAAPGLLLARLANNLGSVVGVSFLSLGLLALLTEHGGNSPVHCTHVRNHGVFLSATLGDLLILFSGCTTLIGGTPEPCTSEGAGTKGNIHLPLATTLFHLGLAHLSATVGKIPAVAVLLDSPVKFECSIAKIKVLGAVIGALQLDPSEKPIPLNTPFSNAILNFEQTTPTSFGLQHLRLILFDDVLRTYDLHSTTTVFSEEPAVLAAEVALALLDLFRLSNGNHVSIELFENS